MSSKIWLTLCLLMSILFLASCSPEPASPTPEANMPNPASVYCEQNGGQVDLGSDASGGVAGVCVFPDGSECDEWAYYRGECQPGDSLATPEASPTSEANMPNPASVYCEQNGGQVDLRSDASGGVAGVCVFPDGSECDEWAYYRGECRPAGSTDIPTPLPIDPADYQGWWTYTSAAYGFSFLLPPDWVVDETTTGDPLMNGHTLLLHPQQNTAGDLFIRMTFRRVGEDALLWPTGVGAGEFVPQGTLEVAGQPARRMAFVCPGGQVNAIWYHGETEANIQRGDMEFGFIASYNGIYCQAGYSLGGKIQRVGDMIIASLTAP